MAPLNIACPQCKAVHQWFSGSTDQRCYKCKYQAVGLQAEQPAQAEARRDSNALNVQLLQQENDALKARVAKLEEQAKNDSGFIELQAQRLARARDHIESIEKVVLAKPRGDTRRLDP